jgi:hypothetical protein
MFDDKSMTPGLAELGYLRLKKRTYRASWSSTDVEHFLFFSLYGGGNYLECDFGLRNPSAERFAIECLKLFAGPIFQDVRFDSRFDCHMRFSLGMSAGWPSRSSLVISKMSGAALADKVKYDVRNVLFPVVRSVLSTADLFSFLVRDDESSRWLRVSGAIRAAQIVYLGRQLGMETTELKAKLQPYLKEIGANIGGNAPGDRVSPSVFLAKVLQYAN